MCNNPFFVVFPNKLLKSLKRRREGKRLPSPGVDKNLEIEFPNWNIFHYMCVYPGKLIEEEKPFKHTLMSM
jgi:hypothetical protein